MKNVEGLFAKLKGVGIKQKDLAEACGVSRAAVSIWRGKGGIPHRFHTPVIRAAAERGLTIERAFLEALAEDARGVRGVSRSAIPLPE